MTENRKKAMKQRIGRAREDDKVKTWILFYKKQARSGSHCEMILIVVGRMSWNRARIETGRQYRVMKVVQVRITITAVKMKRGGYIWELILEAEKRTSWWMGYTGSGRRH